ncbi:MAG: exonuclease SbcCD subunit D [Oscillospiraceae bacterium]
MRFLHTSDWHLGAMDADRSLSDDQRFFIDKICEVITEKNIDAVLLAGDVFDRSVPSAEAIKLYDLAMTKICLELHVPVLCIAGNHDGAERLSSCCELLEAAGLHIVGSLAREPKKVSFDDSEVYFLPWITEEKVKSVYPEEREKVSSLEDAYKIAVGKMKNTFDPDKRHILISHSFITDSETSTSDRAAEIGFATQVSAGVFDGFDYVALGHLHKPQNVNERIRYSGTPMPYSFGKEEKQKKSVTIIDTENMEQTTADLPLLHERHTITGTLDEILDKDHGEAVTNGYLKIVITDCYVGLDTLSKLRRKFPNVLEVVGKSFENENSAVTITRDDFDRICSDPVKVFEFFCKEELGEVPDERLTGLFKNAVNNAEEEL